MADVVGTRGISSGAVPTAVTPARVAEYVSAVTKAFEKKGIISVLKHFPGHGSAWATPDTAAVVSASSKNDFETIHLVPFRAGLKAGADAAL